MDSPHIFRCTRRLMLDVCGEMEGKDMNVGMLISSEASMHLRRPHNRKRRSSNKKCLLPRPYLFRVTDRKKMNLFYFGLCTGIFYFLYSEETCTIDWQFLLCSSLLIAPLTLMLMYFGFICLALHSLLNQMAAFVFSNFSLVFV